MNLPAKNAVKRLTSKPLLEKISRADGLFRENKYNEAIELYKQVLSQIDKTYLFDIHELYSRIGSALYYLNEKDKSLEAYLNAIKYYKKNPQDYSMIAYYYYWYDPNVAIEYYKKAFELSPSGTSGFSTMALALLKSDKYSQSKIKETFEKAISKVRAFCKKDNVNFTFDKEILKTKQKLRIGYLSGDFHNHAMMNFIMPLLENHSKEKFDFILYSSDKKTDFITDRIKETGYEIRFVQDFSPLDIAKEIYKDNIDILVDLSGYTSKKFPTLLYKPAPVQIQYLGFVNTLGMKEVDYILCDEFTVPKEMAKYYTEKPLYLNTTMQRFSFNSKNYTLPPISKLPYFENGYITFGSFNCTSKINDLTISLWSEILKVTENSKLLIFRSQMTPKIMEVLASKFEKNGIYKDRLIFDNKYPEENWRKAYGLCDIGLDTMPFNGLTITTDAILMGIPVLTLAGNSMQSRGCARINKALGLDELISYTKEEYVNKAKSLAGDIKKLEYYRNNLRDIISNSVILNDYKNFALEVESAYKRAWDEFLKNQTL